MQQALLKSVFVMAVLVPNPLMATCPQPAMMYFVQEAAKGVWRNSLNQGIAAFLCCTDSTTFSRDLQFWSSPMQISTPENWQNTMAKIAGAPQKDHLTYVVDLTCPAVEELLLQASKLKLLKIPNRWLLLNTSESTDMAGKGPLESVSQDLKCRHLADVLARSGPGFEALTRTDADVSLVCGTPQTGFVLVDMWAATSLGFWTPDQGFYGDRRVPSARRLAVGLNGYHMKIGFTVEKNESLEHLNDVLDTKTDILTKFNWEIGLNIVKMLNVSPTYHYSNTYGYLVNGTWNGLIGMHLQREIEISVTSIALVSNRASVVKFTNFHMPAYGIFIFRAPPMSYEHNIFTQPFPVSLWLCTIGLVVLSSVMLYIALMVEVQLGVESDNSELEAAVIRLSEGRKGQLEASWSDVALIAVGAVCQQGSPIEARGLTGRTITLFLLIGIVFLFVSYNASIISLLQSTSTSINSYKDMLTSKIKIGVQNNGYNINFLKNLQDPIRKTIYEKKMKNNYMTLEDGIRRVRTSYFAFHTIRSYIYAEIADTFQEHEKCGLVEIRNFLNLQDPMSIISNWSENAELVLLSLRRHQENGIRDRQIRRYLAAKPQCTAKGTNFQSVALIDCEAAFVVWATGVSIALLFFLLENLFFRYQNVGYFLKNRGIDSKDV